MSSSAPDLLDVTQSSKTFLPVSPSSSAATSPATFCLLLTLEAEPFSILCPGLLDTPAKIRGQQNFSGIFYSATGDFLSGAFY